MDESLTVGIVRPLSVSRRRSTLPSQMDVLLDSSAIRASGLNSPAFGSLQEYLSRTKARLLLPSVVLEELCAQCRREIEEARQRVSSANEDLKRLVPGFAPAKNPKIDVEDAVASYRAQLERSAAKVEIVENSSRDFKELVRRLANRIPPASPGGEEARDVLVWLCVLSTGPQQEVAFVSGDKRAFFDEGSLRKGLQRDLKTVPGKVEVYLGIDEFLKAHHRRASWVDENWVTEQVQTQQVEEAIENYIRGHEDRFLSRYGDRGENFTGYANLIQVVQSEVQDFFVSDMTAGALLVGVTLWAELEIEAEYESDLDWPREDYPTTRLRMVHREVVTQLELEVIGRKVKRVSVSDIEKQ